MVKASHLVCSGSLYEAEADYSVSSWRLLLRACEPAVILWFQFSSGGFLSCPPLEQVQWSETWSAAGLPPGWIHCHLLELQPCALSEILLGSVHTQCASLCSVLDVPSPATTLVQLWSPHTDNQEQMFKMTFQSP